MIDKGNWGAAIFAVGAGSLGSIKTEGSGNFVLHSGQSSKNAWINGSLWTAFVNSKDMPAGLLAFGHSGAIRFEGTMWLWLISVDRSQMTRDNFIADGLFNGSRNLEIGPGVHLDVFGNRLNAKKLTTAGDVFSTSTANMGMLKFGADGSNSELYDIGTNVVCVKCGTGSHSMSNATDMAGLSVTTGAVTFVANASGPVHIRSLSMGANTSFALGGNRPFSVDDLTLDASASVAVDRFAPPAGGSLNLLSFTPQSFPAMLPFTAQATQTRTNLGSWSLYYAGVLQGAVGTADPPICIYNHHLCLGIPGMTLSVW